MKNHLILAVVFLFLQTFSLQGQFVTGLLINDESYAAQPALPRGLKFTDANVPFVSLKKFCPIPGNQGSMGSCVGWASAYGAMTISMAIQNNLTDKTQLTNNARSALYIYNQIKVSTCKAGSYIEDACKMLKIKGVPKLVDFNPASCFEQPTTEIHALAMQTRIKDYNILFMNSADAESIIINTRQSLIDKKPVIIGMALTNSFHRIGPDGIWRPSVLEDITGYHAMCVVGYDDAKKQFEILNSWGDNFGKGGFVNVSYSDFAKYCKYAYQFNLQTSDPVEEFSFKSNFQIKKITGYNEETEKLEFQILPAKKSGSYYTLADGAIAKGDFYKVRASEMAKDNYLYIFSVKPDLSAEILYPAVSDAYFGSKLAPIPLIPSKDSYVDIPSDESIGITADFAGMDYIVFLFSKEIIPEIENKANQVAEIDGDINARLKTVFDEFLIPESDIQYSPSEMKFSGKSSNGVTVPLVLKIPVKE